MCGQPAAHRGQARTADPEADAETGAIVALVLERLAGILELTCWEATTAVGDIDQDLTTRGAYRHRDMAPRAR
jgi:hypothetical protein